eukprot:scaffold41918_cov34-Phaeocystis_antarctica.AAC.1
MAAALQGHGAVDVLLRVGQSDRANPQLRLMCSTTLSFLTNVDATKAPGQGTHKASEEAVGITRQLEEVNLEKMLVVLPLPLPLSLTLQVNGLEKMLVALVKAHGRPGLQT